MSARALWGAPVLSRARLAWLSALSLSAACSGWLMDWSGTRCAIDGDCGGGLVCVKQACAPRSGSDGADTSGFGDASGFRDASESSDATETSDASGSPDASNASGPSDASNPSDASSSDASGFGDASGFADASTSDGADKTPLPTFECSGDAGWCAARIPAPDGGSRPMTALAGRAPNNLWAVGGGATIVHWDGEFWEDQSSMARANAADAGFPVDEMTTVSVTSDVIMFAGSYRSGATKQTAFSWKYIDAVGASFITQVDSSGQLGFGWLGSAPSGNHWALVGESAHVRPDDLYGGFQDGTGGDLPDYRAVSLRSDDELWIAGTSGAVRYMRRTDASSSSAVGVGFPATSINFDAILALDDVLLVAGEGALYECARTGSTMSPSLAGCQNHVSSVQTIRSLAGTSAADVWAAGFESGVPLLLRRTGVQAWQGISVPAAAGPLSGVWRGPGLVVVAGEGGLFSTAGY